MSIYPSKRFETPIFLNGIPYWGVIQPIEDQKLYTDDYFYHRQILRVRPDVPITAGRVIQDHLMQRFLLGELDIHREYRSFQMYKCNKEMTWKREVAEFDLLTGLAKSTGTRNVGAGTFWGLSETLNKEISSRNIKAAEEVKRILTGEDVQLNDIVDGMKVKRINYSHGIRILEVI